LPTPAIINKEVLEGEKCLSKGLKKGSIYVDISTNSPETVLKIHSAMKKLGVEMLDAPINSCPVGTKSLKGIGLISIMVGGSKKTFEQVRPILQLMADHVLYCGEISCGIQCKLIHNAVNAIMEDKPIYVFDEWAADQDPHFRHYFYETLLPSFKKQGKTVIAVTHDDRYFHVADQVILLEYGVA
jgi:ABC-type Na+ transport system ATPase subunit NatA